MSENAQLGDNVVVSAIANQRIVFDPQLHFVALTKDRRLEEAEDIQISCI